MATTVFTGWRTITPGPCDCCGSDCDWDCDGRGTVYCSCQCCPECGGWDGHDPSCPVVLDDQWDPPSEREPSSRQMA